MNEVIAIIENITAEIATPCLRDQSSRVKIAVVDSKEISLEMVVEGTSLIFELPLEQAERIRQGLTEAIEILRSEK